MVPKDPENYNYSVNCLIFYKKVSVEERNTELMKTLDDGWNSQDWDKFE
jgi:hypothetical protein